MSTATSGVGRMEEFLSSVPVVTRALLVINCLVHILIFALSLSLNTFAVSAHLVVDDGEYYRIFSAAWVHAGLMHIFMNMSSLLQLGLSLEAHFGSLQFMFLTLWSVFAVGILYVFMAEVFSFVDPRQLYSSGVGYSGVLFCYALIEAYHTTETTRSIFGMFNVPSRMYPFILLIILQVVIPNISFLGHASGIIVGLLVVYGSLNFLLPSTDFLLHLETLSIFGPLTKASGYVRAGHRNMVYGSGGAGGNTCFSGCSSICAMFQTLLVYVWNILAAALFIVGVPTDRIATCCSDAAHKVTQFISSWSSPTERNAVDNSVELGRYARINADIESTTTQSTAGPLAPTTNAGKTQAI
jgi:membrane associated rhomboid family serine protease